MGGYGGYVWPAFGFTLVLTLGLAWQSWWLQRRRSAELALLRQRIRPKARAGGGDRPARRLVAVRADEAAARADGASEQPSGS